MISRHLKVLKDAKIISFENQGKAKYYSVNREGTAKFLRAVADRIERHTCCNEKVSDPIHTNKIGGNDEQYMSM